MTLREEICSRPLRPYDLCEPISMPPPPVLQASVDRAVKGPWRRDGVVLPDLRSPLDWTQADRSARFNMQAWGPVSPLLVLHSLGRGERYFDLALNFAAEWLALFQAPLAGSDEDVLARLVDPAFEDFTWYDMAVGQRVYRLAYILDVAARRAEVPDALIELMVASIHDHLALLARPEFFRDHNNHGLFQALGMVAAARRFHWWPGMPDRFERGVAMLREMLDTQFFDEGVHREHSPGYHYMILLTLLTARKAGLIDDRIAETLKRAERAMMWMSTPGRQLAPFGDTDPRRLDSGGVDQSLYGDPTLLNVMSRGAVGEPPPSGVTVYPQAGYAFARIHDGDPSKASYLAMQGGFHSNVHKHADHLTFVWSEGATDILTDPGRFGYLGKTTRGDALNRQGFRYDDPRRVYVESTSAHNAVEIDGTSHRRARRDPFGAADITAEEQGGLVVLNAEVEYAPVSTRHRRTLILSPGKFLVCLDILSPQEPRVFRQWFQLATEWDAQAEAAGLVARTSGVELHVADLFGGAAEGPWKGSQDPLRGWTSLRSKSLTPSPSFAFRREVSSEAGAKPAVFATVFSLDGPVEPLGKTRANRRLSRVVLAWRTPARRTVLRCDWGEGGLQVSRRRKQEGD